LILTGQEIVSRSFWGFWGYADGHFETRVGKGFNQIAFFGRVVYNALLSISEGDQHAYLSHC
jgi:hypothetical protein